MPSPSRSFSHRMGHIPDACVVDRDSIPCRTPHWSRPFGLQTMTYDETDIAQRYDSARHMPEGTLYLWLDAMARHVQPGDIRTIVDVGCGTGRLSAALADAFDADVIGVEPSLTMLAKARGGVSHPRINFRAGEAEHLPVDDASACLVYLSMVYHHLGQPPPYVLPGTATPRQWFRATGYLEPGDGGGASAGSAVSGTSSRNTWCPPRVSPLAMRCAATLSVKGPTRTR
jgi:SAM-dependent methyltransferase